jgi:hypothetical protein
MQKITISGTPFAVGQRLGEFGRHAWHQKLVHIPLWQTVIAMKDSAQTQAMRALVEEQFPLIWQELAGMAAGLQAPVDEVFAWNCRGDLVRSTSDGCTTVAGASPEGRALSPTTKTVSRSYATIARGSVFPHRGDGLFQLCIPRFALRPYLRSQCPGIVNTVNNIRALHRPVGIPRQILARCAECRDAG